MIKALIVSAALLGSTAALAQNSMDASTSGAMSNGSMSSGSMSNGSMSNGSMMSNGSTMSNGSMSSGSGGMMANADKCAKKYPSYDASTGMYMKNGKSMKCKLK